MTWWSRLRRRKQLEDDLERELRFHLDEHAGDLISRGHTPDQALRRARLALGGYDQVKERCRDARGTRWLEDILQDTRYALRTLRQNRGFAAVTIMTLALGIGALTVMFAVVNSVLLNPLPFSESDRLVALHGFMQQFGEFWGFSKPDFDDARRESRSLELAAWTYGGGTVSAPGQPEYVDGRQISASLFATLGVAPLDGRAFLPEEDRPGAAPVLILSYRFWRRRFAGDPSVVGKTVVYDGKAYAVVGITPAGFQLSGNTDVFTPLDQNTDPRMQNRAAHFIHAIGRLRPGVTFTEAQSEVALIARNLAKQYPESNNGIEIRLQPLLRELVGDVRTTLWLLFSAVALVLLIACVNIATLVLTRAISRAREIAMRVALGARWSRLARQCLTESAVLSICGGLLGTLVAKISVRPFVMLWPGDLPRADEIRLDWRVFAFGIGVSLLSALFFGLAPALRVPLHGLDAALRAGGRTTTGSRCIYGASVVAEIALAFVLLASAGILGNTLLKLSSLNPGFDAHNVLTAHFALSPVALRNPPQIRAAWQDVLDRARRLPDMESAALSDIIPMRVGENSLPYRTTSALLPPNEEPFALASCVTPDYLKVMGIPLRRGRFFNEHDREGSEPVVVIDENLARHAFGGQEAVGRRLWSRAFGDAPVRIIGVVGHVRHWGLAGDDQSRVRDQMYYPLAQVPVRYLPLLSSVMSIAVRTKGPAPNILNLLRAELRGASGDQALYEPRTMDELVSASLARQRFLLVLFAIFSGIALLLASIGIYGVVAYLTGQRVPEIGIRVALGATVENVIGMIMQESVRLLFVGLAIGVAAAMIVGPLLRRAVQGMQSVPFAIFAIVIPLLAAAVMAASFVPARRASRIDPVAALRQD